MSKLEPRFRLVALAVPKAAIVVVRLLCHRQASAVWRLASAERDAAINALGCGAVIGFPLDLAVERLTLRQALQVPPRVR